MASELKPFGYAPGSYMNNCKSCGQSFMGDKLAWNCEPCAKALSLQADTRPAPAATDTGLVTVGIQYAHEHSITGRTMWGWHKEWKGCSAIGTRELVTRSQAEAIIAARDAEISELKKALADREWISDKHNKQRSKSEADNAALTARIAELEQINADLCRSHGVLNVTGAKLEGQVEALETKLAAAEKALERMVSEYDEVDLSHDEPPSMTSAVMEARAVLGGKPS